MQNSFIDYYSQIHINRVESGLAGGKGRRN